MTIDKECSTELFVFDFDETIVNCNSDTYIDRLAPGGVIPEQLWKSFKNDNDWTAYMQQVFAYLHSVGIREDAYKKCLATMPFVEWLPKLLANLENGTTNKRFEVVIISDANSFFIGYALEHHKLNHIFMKVFTNPAHFDANGCLQIERFHEQNWCKLSSRNLCKGHIMKDFIAKRLAAGVHYDRINYAGDGSNDLCPSLKLSKNDRVFPRSGYPLHRLLANRKESGELSAQVFPFTSGEDIWKVLTS
ncbi:hypothetical protein RDWZM_003778 [Blomia tropicalis]|uniref:Uncharacterized protein n=1 Tax=Blomia tropicalis TaxID=40697 RepID=A0A9Q0RR75_BLOTA|nr:hypothetical protein RDWZM_003778 [Blomia tropicalis]